MEQISVDFKGVDTGMSGMELTIKIKCQSEDELVKELAESIQKSDRGGTKSARTVSKNMREKYAV